jgi:hypothetical protein
MFSSSKFSNKLGGDLNLILLYLTFEPSEKVTTKDVFTKVLISQFLNLCQIDGFNFFSHNFSKVLIWLSKVFFKSFLQSFQSWLDMVPNF